MRILTVYEYTKDGMTTISTKLSEDAKEYTSFFRLVADKDKRITNGDKIYTCIDVYHEEELHSWYECDYNAFDDELGDISSSYEETLSELERLKLDVIQQMSNSCNSAITSGTTVKLSDGQYHHFGLTAFDQINLLHIQHKISEDSDIEVVYHATNELAKFYSSTDMLAIVSSANQHVMFHTNYFNSLKNYINTLTDSSLISSIRYGIMIPDNYKSEALLSLE